MSHKTSQIAVRGEGLTLKYGDFTAVDGLDLAVRAGEIFGFLGPNGAGKTTSIKMMTGMLRPSSGKAFVGPKEIQSHTKEIKKQVGVCPQDVVVWEKLTCLENLVLMGRMFGIRKRDAYIRAGKLLDRVGLAEKAGVRASKLSGGMKKRLNLTMALIHDPEIIVLDEPITGLDPQSRLLVSDFIRDLCRTQGKTVILTTHLMEVAAKLSDRIAIIDHGKLQALDTLENLKRTTGEGDVVEVQMANEEETEAALQMIKSLDGVDQAGVHDGKIRFQALDAVNLLPEISRRIDNAGSRIEGLSLRSSTLEDIFISLTGRKMRD
jgi:ABC-2 type transport system ATP-binding protein